MSMEKSILSVLAFLDKLEKLPSAHIDYGR